MICGTLDRLKADDEEEKGERCVLGAFDRLTKSVPTLAQNFLSTKIALTRPPNDRNPHSQGNIGAPPKPEFSRCHSLKPVGNPITQVKKPL